MKLRYYLRGLGIGIVVTALLMGVALKDGHPLSDAEIKRRAAQLGMVEKSYTLSELQPETEESKPQESQVAESTQTTESGQSAAEESKPQENQPAESTQASESSQSAAETSNASESQTAESTQTTESSQSAAEASKPSESQPAESTPASESSQPAAEESRASESQTTESTQITESSQPAETSGETAVVVVHSGDSSDTVSRALEEAGLVENAKKYDQYLINNGYSRRISPGTYEMELGTDEETIAKIITKSR